MKTSIQGRVGATTLINGKFLDVFAGTGYLGLQSHPRVIRAAADCLEQYGVSSTIPRGGLGEHPVYAELETRAAEFFGAEKASLFASGYLGPSFLAQSTATLYDVIFIDSDAHFSIWDAAQGTNKPIFVFHHRDPDDLERQLAAHLKPNERPLVFTDGVFPISGEIAPLDAYLPLIENLSGRIFVDDAHAGGVLGPHGRGTTDYFALPDGVVRSCVTLSKAFGTGGGLIYGTRGWVEALEKASRISAGASSIPLAMAAAAAASLQIAREEPSLREQLWRNVSKAKQGMREIGFAMDDSPVPILCIPAQAGLNLIAVRDRLFDRGIAVEWVQQYTSVPAGGALRIAIFATHSESQIRRLIDELSHLI